MAVRFYRWSYSWQTIKALYIQKQKETAERTNIFCEFLVTLTTAALGGSSEAKNGEVGLDTGDDMDELTDEQIEMWKEVLGEAEFAQTYPDYV